MVRPALEPLEEKTCEQIFVAHWRLRWSRTLELAIALPGLDPSRAREMLLEGADGGPQKAGDHVVGVLAEHHGGLEQLRPELVQVVAGFHLADKLVGIGQT